MALISVVGGRSDEKAVPSSASCGAINQGEARRSVTGRVGKDGRNKPPWAIEHTHRSATDFFDFCVGLTSASLCLCEPRRIHDPLSVDSANSELSVQKFKSEQCGA